MVVSEGVDIPRLRVGVYATHTVTDLFFRQAVGRLVRRTDPRRAQPAYMFIPDDIRLRGFAHGIAEQRRHSLRKPERDDEGPVLDGNEDGETEAPADQMSLFSVISAVALEADGAPLEPSQVIDESESEIPGLVGDEEEDEDDEEPDFQLTAPDLEPPEPEPEPALSAGPRSLHSRKRELREKNSACVRRLVHSTGNAHADVNAALNRYVGIRRITQATVAQLEKRLAAADRWLARGRLG